MLDDEAKDYMLWRRNHTPTQDQLEEQRSYVFKEPVFISVVVPVYNTPVKYLREMIASVMAQTYQNWELCMADGCSTNTEVREIIKEAAEKDSRVKYIFLDKNGGISVHINEAINLSSGEYIAFVDSDDTLTPDALYEIAKTIEDEPDLDFIYTDSEDVHVEAGIIASRFKPNWNPVRMFNENYIIHLVVVRRSIVLTLGMMDNEFNEFQDSDFLYKVSEVTDRIKHIHKILYSWFRRSDSTSAGIISKDDESEKKRLYELKAISSKLNHLKRLGLSEAEANWFFYDKPESITVNLSIITAFYGGLDLLTDFLDSVCFKKEGYVIEVIVINMTEDTSDETIDALKPGLLKVINYASEIDSDNISAAYNYAASVASGDYLAFTNYSVKFSGGDFFNWLIPFTFYPGSGLITGVVEYKDRFNTVALMGDQVGVGFPPEEIYIRTRQKPKINHISHWLPQLFFAKNVTTVSDAFAVVKKTVFGEVGGFDENFPCVFYMMDLSLRLNNIGYRHVACGNARIILDSRRHPLYAEGTDIFEEELELFYDRHYDAINSPDPYANPNII